jgi:CRISPR-associated protein Cas1
MQQLRGREGARIRAVYRLMSKRTGVPWTGREYDPEDFSASDPVNKALSAAHACLYGVAHSVIVALGCSPGLGFVHTGHERSFVYDIADLYKADLTIPIAFEVASRGGEPEEIGANARRAVRDAISDGNIMERVARDVRILLLPEGSDPDCDVDPVKLWDEKSGFVKNAVAYGRNLNESEIFGTGYGHILEDA